MNASEQICELLDSVKEKLVRFEKETIEILSCDMEKIEGHTENRVSITKELDVIFGQIDDICSTMENGAKIRKIIKNVSAFTDVAPEEEEIFLKAQEIFSVLNRIKDSDIQAVDRINLEKEMLIRKIKQTNRGQEAKAAKFSVGTDDGGKKHFGESGKSI